MRKTSLSSVFSLLSSRAARGSAPTIVVFSLLTSAAVAADTAFIKLPPAVYGGVVRDYMFAPYGSANAAEVYARRAMDGKLLASGTTFDLSDGINYTVSLPIVSAASDGVVGLRYGEQATFSFVADGVFWKNLATVTVGAPGYRRLDVIVGHDENGDGIVDEYVAYIEAEMRTKYGLEGPYDPEADYNHDGVSNRAHYLAGTYPFAGLTVGGEVIADQTCTISKFMNVRSFTGSDHFAITFNAVEEGCYSVLALEDLKDGWGNATTVASRERLDGGDSEVEHWADESGEMTLYVPRDEKAKQKFYMLQVGW